MALDSDLSQQPLVALVFAFVSGMSERLEHHLFEPLVVE
jgi:hypothetical protein